MSVSLKVYHPRTGFSPARPEIFQFPGGEWHLKNLPSTEPRDGVRPFLVGGIRGCRPDDLAKIALWGSVALERKLDYVVIAPYLPAARADRGEPLGIEAYAALLQAGAPTEILSLDVHNPEAAVRAYSETLVNHDPVALLSQALKTSSVTYDAVIAPDEGAAARAAEVARALHLPVSQWVKHRDFETGRITGIERPEGFDRTLRYLVVDDICDGGSTFVHLAQAAEVSPERLGLWVTHGIFSGNAGQLREYYGTVMTTDSHPGCRSLDVKATVVRCGPHLLNRYLDELHPATQEELV